MSLLNQGYQYLTEQRYDEMDPILEILRTNLVDLGLPLRSLEVEFGPSQVEFTFRAGTGLEPADAMVLFRSAAKQVAQRHGYHATFMCRPKLPNVMSSGWHLHQSLNDRKTDANAFIDADASRCRRSGMHYMAGLLAHARGAAAFSTPTLNGYKRYRPFSLAPDRATWGRDNRGVMVRVLGGPGDPATHLENRVGEPAANPYLYMASQIVSGLDGLDRKLDPGPSADTPYESQGAGAAALARRGAGRAAASDKALRAGFGDFFVDYYLKLKQAEIDRFDLGSQRLGTARVFFAVLSSCRTARPPVARHFLRLPDDRERPRPHHDHRASGSHMSEPEARGPEARMQLPKLVPQLLGAPAIVSTQRQYIVHQLRLTRSAMLVRRPAAVLQTFHPFALVPPQQRVPRLTADPGLRTQLRHHRPFFFAASTNCIRSSMTQVSFHGIGRPSCRALKPVNHVSGPNCQVSIRSVPLTQPLPQGGGA